MCMLTQVIINASFSSYAILQNAIYANHQNQQAWQMKPPVRNEKIRILDHNIHLSSPTPSVF